MDLTGDLAAGRQDPLFGFIAHVVGDSADGPRGDPVRSPQLAKAFDNLMLMCPKHHKLIDVDAEEAHPEDLLLSMAWQAEQPGTAFRVREADGTPRANVALVLAPSASVTDERIGEALGEDTSIWSITADAPHNDIMRKASDLSAFRVLLRRMFDRIKVVHGEAATINVFPVLPVSAAVEVGRVWMSKADLPLIIFDQNRAVGGFRPALDIAQQ